MNMVRVANTVSTLCIRISSVLFLVAAVAILYGGSLLIKTYRNYEPFFHDFDILIPCGLIIGGAALLVINGLLGFKISPENSRCKQGIFMYIIVLLLCLEASGVTLAYVYKNKMDYELHPMENAFNRYNDSTADNLVNNIQKELKCCGLRNYTDWESTDWFKHSGNDRVPESCCNVTFVFCSANLTESNKLYHEGCFLKLHQRIDYFMSWLTWSCIALICVEVLAAIGSGALMVRNPFRDFRILDSGVFT